MNYLSFISLWEGLYLLFIFHAQLCPVKTVLLVACFPPPPHPPPTILNIAFFFLLAYKVCCWKFHWQPYGDLLYVRKKNHLFLSRVSVYLWFLKMWLWYVLVKSSWGWTCSDHWDSASRMYVSLLSFGKFSAIAKSSLSLFLALTLSDSYNTNVNSLDGVPYIPQACFIGFYSVFFSFFFQMPMFEFTECFRLLLMLSSDF